MTDWLEAEQRVERAQQLSESQRWAEALAELDVALSINPDNSMWHAHRGFLLDELDRLEDAIGAYSHSLELEPGDSEVAMALGVALTRVDRFAKALAVFEGLTRRHPDLEPAYCHRIGIYAELGKHDEAEEMFYRAQELDDHCPHCFFHIGASLAARDQIPRALYCWRRVLELDPGYLGVKRRIGQAYRTQGEVERAREFLIAELRDNPGDIDLLFELAELAVEMDQLATAAAKFAQILELEPACIEARFALGRVWLRRGQPEEALKCFEAVTGHARELADFERLYAEALLRMGRVSEARRHLEAVVDDHTDDTGFLSLLGDCLLASNRPEAAADRYRQVLAIDDRNAFAHNSLGVCLLQAGRQEAGLAHCLTALEHKADYGMAMQNAAIALLQLGQWRKARAMLSKALAADPDNATLRETAQRLWRYRVRYYARRLWQPVRSLFLAR